MSEPISGIDPLGEFRNAWAAATASGVARADAMALATVASDGRPSVRQVLCKSADERGLTFYTNLGSQKAHDLEANPMAALCFFWAPLQQQVRFEGPVALVPDAEADAYFATRPRASQIGAWASRQSETIADYDQLMASVAGYRERFAGQPVPRPPFWSGYLLQPDRIEFWYGREDRLHHRKLYLRGAAGWTLSLLQP